MRHGLIIKMQTTNTTILDITRQNYTETELNTKVQFIDNVIVGIHKQRKQFHASSNMRILLKHNISLSVYFRVRSDSQELYPLTYMHRLIHDVMTLSIHAQGSTNIRKGINNILVLLRKGNACSNISKMYGKRLKCPTT